MMTCDYEPAYVNNYVDQSAIVLVPLIVYTSSKNNISRCCYSVTIMYDWHKHCLAFGELILYKVSQNSTAFMLYLFNVTRTESLW